MYFFRLLLSSLALFSTSVSGAIIPGKRDLVEVGRTGTIVDPSTDVQLSPGQSIPFTYEDINECYADFTPIDVYVLADVPNFSDLNATGQYSEGDYLYYFGNWDIHNFNLPPTTSAPPTTLVIPDLNISGPVDVYLTIVETDTNCASGHLTEYGLTYIDLQYSDSL